VILTSGPPHCVHVLGHYLKRSFSCPWVADFRDPWISDGRSKKLTWLQRWARRWERRVFANADLVLANAPNACRMMQEIYPGAATKVVTLTNGFDPHHPFACASRSESNIELLHAGEIYAGRNPAPLLDALTALNRHARYRLRLLGRVEKNADAPAFVTWAGQCSYRDTLDAMQRADILVLFDTPGRTIGVPAKLYEYLGAGRPILALAEKSGDAANVLRDAGVLHRLAAPTDAHQIEHALRELTTALQAKQPIANSAQLERFTRRHLAGALAHRLDALIGSPCVTAARIDVAFSSPSASMNRPSCRQEQYQ
jgi:hypothetical protein